MTIGEKKYSMAEYSAYVYDKTVKHNYFGVCTSYVRTYIAIIIANYSDNP